MIEPVIAGLLTQFLPHLLRAGQRVGDQAADALGTETGRLARRVWDRLGQAFESRPAAKEAAENLAAKPADDLAREDLELQVRKILRDDPGLRKELSAMLEDARGQGIVADRGGVVNVEGVNARDGGIAVGRDLHGNVRTSR